jgi:2'-5' RNA ligase
VRAFVALELPEPVRREAARRVAAVRERLPEARWVRPEALHLTLRFLGEVDPASLLALSAALAPAFAAAPRLLLALHGGGCYPPGRPARVAWTSVRAAGGRSPDPPGAADLGSADPPADGCGAVPLPALQARVESAAVAALGVEPETRPFSPHVTLARAKRPWNRVEVETFGAALAGAVGEPFEVDHGSLIESRLSPEGSRYRTIETFPLGAA